MMNVKVAKFGSLAPRLFAFWIQKWIETCPKDLLSSVESRRAQANCSRQRQVGVKDEGAGKAKGKKADSGGGHAGGKAAASWSGRALDGCMRVRE